MTIGPDPTIMIFLMSVRRGMGGGKLAHLSGAETRRALGKIP
jgi:hypothetical protein